MTITELAGLIRQGLAEDERIARLAADDARGMGIAYDEPVHWRNSDGNVHLDGGYGSGIAVGGYGGPIGDEVADHMARHDPARVLAKVAGKRALLDEALNWEHHPGDRNPMGEPCQATHGGPCDCGRDARVLAVLTHLAQPYQETT